MGAADRRALLREVAELLAYVRTPQFQDQAAHIFEGVRAKLEEVKDDVEESAENLEERFPDRADDLRSDWEWVEEAHDKAEEAVDELLHESPSPERIVELAGEITGEIVEEQVPRRQPPALSVLLERVRVPKPAGVPTEKETLEQIGKRVYGQLSQMRKSYPTFPYIRGVFREGLITQDEYRLVLEYVARLLDRTNLGEFNRFFEHETTREDIETLDREAGLPSDFRLRFVDFWSQQIERGRLIRETTEPPRRRSPWS